MATRRPIPLDPDIGFAPTAQIADPLAAHWLRQVNLRLRREVAWMWAQRGLLDGVELPPAGLPPAVEPLREALNLARFEDDRRDFFETDATAGYLTARIDEMPPPVPVTGSPAGAASFAAVVHRLQLEPAACFVAALALAHRTDSAIGCVFAAVAGDTAANAPSLALARRLWGEDPAFVAMLAADHPLNRFGLLAARPGGWEAPLAMSPHVARALLDPDAPWPHALRPVEPGDLARIEDGRLAVARLADALAEHATVVVPLQEPKHGAADAPGAAEAAALAAAAGFAMVALASGAGRSALAELLPLAGLKRAALFLRCRSPDDVEALAACAEGPLPPVLFLALDRGVSPVVLSSLPLLPTVRRLPLDYPGRLARWRAALPVTRVDADLDGAVADCARRFRFDDARIDGVARTLSAMDAPITPEQLFAACRADVDLGTLAEPIVPRFGRDELVLPVKQANQIAEIVQGIRALAEVHYEWGTGRAWAEGGLSVLFAGPPGTGKSMAAEVIAREVSMPLFRIDLSQVVDKYIGETEKNLSALFDAADRSDAILFFDEADAIFSRRTEVKGSNDRYANLQVNYLLQRMERLNGLAILATNRKKDLDEAFLRRLRAVVDFPLPGPAERLGIWRRAIPAGVDASTVDLDFLAERLPLAGGHIRSIVLQACLQRARPGSARSLDMAALVRATRRELEKLGRPLNIEQFGPHAIHLRDETE